MKYSALLLLGSALSALTCQGQAARQLAKGYQAAVRALDAVSYDVQRIDTFPDQTVWNHRGRVLLQRAPGAPLLGARFLATQHDAGAAYWYDGKTGYFLNNKAKDREADPTPYAPSVLGRPGGQMLVPELLGLEPGYLSLTVKNTAQGQLLTLHYPDLPKYDELNRYTYLTLDKATHLPRQVRTVSRKAGATWSITKVLSNVRLNSAADVAALRSQAFLKTHAPKLPPPPPPMGGPVLTANVLKDRPAADFKLLDLKGATVQLSSFRGRPVLLDFWTTWCGPCIASMPKVEQLRATYAQRGLVVLGVLMDPQNAERAKGILLRQGATYANLRGNDAVEAGYEVRAFPTYVLVGADGNIAFSDAGFSPQIEEAVKVALPK